MNVLERPPSTHLLRVWWWCFYLTLPTILAYKPSVQSLSRVQLFVTPWTAARQASLFITNSRRLLKLTSIKPVMPSNHLILSSPSPPAFSLSQHQGLSPWVRSSHQGPKYWSFSFSNLYTIGYKIIEKINHNKQGVFKPLLVICWLTLPWPKQVTCPNLKTRNREMPLFEKRSMKDFEVIKIKKERKKLNSTSYRTSWCPRWLGLCTSSAGGTGLIPGWGPKTTHAAGHGQK